MNWTQFALLQLLIASDTTRVYVESDGRGDEAVAHLSGFIKIPHADLKEMVECRMIEINSTDGHLTIEPEGLQALHDGCNRFGEAMDLLERAVRTEMSAPDEKWFQDYFALTGEHMILTDEGWTDGASKSAYKPDEILAEVNAPSESCHYCGDEFDASKAQSWRVSDKPTCWNCYSRFAEEAHADADAEMGESLHGIEGAVDDSLFTSPDSDSPF